ncbi:MAG: hypothetical protein ACOY46_02675 [Bacillota bacterium]
MDEGGVILRGCKNCGFLINNNCFVFGINLKAENIRLYLECAYFKEPVFEDGEAIEPERLLLLAENEIRRRK